MQTAPVILTSMSESLRELDVKTIIHAAAQIKRVAMETAKYLLVFIFNHLPITYFTS
jgi:hypothetical protein